jgi:hypothetical protein
MELATQRRFQIQINYCKIFRKSFFRQLFYQFSLIQYELILVKTIKVACIADILLLHSRELDPEK